ncbi:MAG: hypothetical protein JNJ88_20945 [Planctomycetes bacterium]|nr:hypothetical protein [Planctomycetota bacterium]
MSGAWNALRAIVAWEWKRRRRAAATWSILCASAWQAALALHAPWRDGSASADAAFLTTAALAAVLGSDAFARDTRSGVWEFCIAQGARPLGLFGARLAVALGAVAAHLCLFIAVEQTRLSFLYEGEISPQWLSGSVGILAAKPREALLLYLLPGTAIFTLVSALSLRSSAALLVGGLASAALFGADRWLGAPQDLAPLTGAVSSISLAGLAGALLALAALAAHIRRREPDRAGPRRALLAGATLAIAMRFVATASISRGEEAGGSQPLRLSVSPNGRYVAIEAEVGFQVPEFAASLAQSLGRSVSREGGETRVAVAELDGRARWVTDLPAAFATAGCEPAWITEKLLLVRGLDPYSSDPLCSPQCEYLYDAGRARILPAPPVRVAAPSATKTAALWIREGDRFCEVQAVAGTELVRESHRTSSSAEPGSPTPPEAQDLGALEGETRLRFVPKEGLYAVGPDGKLRRLWPPLAMIREAQGL